MFDFGSHTRRLPRRRPAPVRIFAVMAAVCALAASASAYTLVMRGGRRVEVPERFSLTGTTLTYEASPGVYVTLQLAHVDVEATERENREPHGGFFRHALAQPGPAQAKVPAESRPAARVLTNRELEPARRARLESEERYERRRKELGLPPIEETRRRAEEDAESLRGRGRRARQEESPAEAYWRARAAALRGELRALDAGIAYLREALAEQPEGSTSGFALGSAMALGGFHPFLRAPLSPPPARTPVAGLEGVNFGAFQTDGVGTIATAQLGGGRTFGGPETRARLGRRGVRGAFARRHFGGIFAPGLVGIGVPFDYSSADAPALFTRLRLLEAERTGLEERWRLLEEEARRAGALPGWLRP